VVLVPVSAEDFARRKRRIRAAWAAAILLAAGAAVWIYVRSTDPLRAKESYDAGVGLYETARYSQAILAFDRAISLNPGFADAFVLRGRSRLAISDLEGAIRDFGEAIKLRPNAVQARLERGAAYLVLKNHQAALEDGNRVLSLDPKQAAAYNLRGTALRSMGKTQEALENFNQAVELSPTLENYFQRGATYQALGQHKPAIADFDEAIQFRPFSAQAYFARAVSKLAIGDEAGAREDRQRGRQLDGR
jgi:tetratricopeptide (TPR) repeat protein